MILWFGRGMVRTHIAEGLARFVNKTPHWASRHSRAVRHGTPALVEAGEGVAILAHGSTILHHNELVVVPLADRTALTDLVIALAPQHENPVLRSFLDVVLKRRRP
jgi:DNA-binding transcriptional LysR family regulator